MDTIRAPKAFGWLLIAGVLGAFPGGQIRGADDDKDAGAAARKKSEDSLVKIGVAFHKYAETNMGSGLMPPAALLSKDGKPLLSWRVLLLPQLGEKELFEQFKLNEPWDSPHNKKLLEKMPEVYAPIAGEARKKFSTYYQVFVGPNTPFSQKGRGPHMPRSFPDGTSVTILVIEAAEALPWTAPRDIDYDVKKPIPKLGGLFADGYHAVMADGSVRFIKNGKLTDKTLRNAIDPADGQVLGADW